MFDVLVEQRRREILDLLLSVADKHSFGEPVLGRIITWDPPNRFMWKWDDELLDFELTPSSAVPGSRRRPGSRRAHPARRWWEPDTPSAPINWWTWSRPTALGRSSAQMPSRTWACTSRWPPISATSDDHTSSVKPSTIASIVPAKSCEPRSEAGPIASGTTRPRKAKPKKTASMA